MPQIWPSPVNCSPAQCLCEVRPDVSLLLDATALHIAPAPVKDDARFSLLSNSPAFQLFLMATLAPMA
jgi:hypothetical protein